MAVSARRGLVVRTIAFGIVVLCAQSAPRSAAVDHLLHGASGLDHGIPNFCASGTIVSARSGAWSDPATWTQGRVPREGDRVGIRESTTVTYDVVSAEPLRCVGIDGTLTFKTDVDTQLTVGDLLVRLPGTLEIGTQAAPVAAGRHAAVVIADQPLDVQADPEQFGTGLVVLGRVRIHGAVKQHTFVRAANEMAAGGTAIGVDEDVSDWRAGDRVMIPDSRYLRPGDGLWSSREVRTVATAGGRQVTLASALTAAHPCGQNGDGKNEFCPHLGNLTRNVTIRSMNPRGTRGHTIYVANADVDIRYASFVDLGRTTLDPLDISQVTSSGEVTKVGKNQIGRYAVHFHHLRGPRTSAPAGYQYVFQGNAIENSNKWAITIHRTHYGLVKDNVIHNAHGAGIMTEDGSESQNVIEGNFVAGVDGDGNRGDGRANSIPPDLGTEGSGIWMRGPNNKVRRNVVANVRLYGYMFFYGGIGSMPIPVKQGSESLTQFDFSKAPALEFADNETYSVVTGSAVWFVNSPLVMTRTRSWHTMSYAFYGYPSSHLVFDGWVIRGNHSAMNDSSDQSVGIWFGDYETQDSLIVRADIQNMKFGVIAPLVSTDPWAGASAPSGIATIQDSYFRNFYDIQIRTMYFTGSGRLAPKTTVIRNSRFVAPRITRPQEWPPAAIAMNFTPNQVSNNVQNDRVFVYDFNQVKGDNFQVFYLEQAPDFVLPAIGNNGPAREGMTNDQAWKAHQVAVAGAIAPCATRRKEVLGFVCSLPQNLDLPGAPANARAVK